MRAVCSMRMVIGDGREVACLKGIKPNAYT